MVMVWHTETSKMSMSRHEYYKMVREERGLCYECGSTATHIEPGQSFGSCRICRSKDVTPARDALSEGAIVIGGENDDEESS